MTCCMRDALCFCEKLVDERIWKPALSCNRIEAFLQIRDAAALHEIASAEFVTHNDRGHKR